MPFSGQKWHFWTMKIQVLCPFAILSLVGTPNIRGIKKKFGFWRKKQLEKLKKHIFFFFEPFP